MANAKYCEMNEKIEYVTESYHNFAMKYNSLAIFLPALFITAVNYFILDLGNGQSYFLPIAILYVENLYI